MKLKKQKGAVDTTIILIICFMFFFIVILPIIFVALEKYMINIVKNDTVSAVEISLYSALTTLKIDSASSENFDFDNVEFQTTFRDYLAKNMRLNPDLTPTSTAYVHDQVVINRLEYFGSATLPYTSPVSGKIYTRPFFQVELALYIRPTFLRALMQDLLGVQGHHYILYDAVSMPIDN